MSTPPGTLVNSWTLNCERDRRFHIKIRSRGKGTYVLSTSHVMSSPRIRFFKPNGEQSGSSYDFSRTGRPRNNWLVWHTDSNGLGSFKIGLDGVPGQSMGFRLRLLPPGTPLPSGGQWMPSDANHHRSWSTGCISRIPVGDILVVPVLLSYAIYIFG